MPAVETIDLIHRIASAQGVIFLKDLLREKKRAGERVNLGGSKREVLGNLLDAVERNIITEQDILDWLDGIEGWGHQHVYLYKLSETLGRRRFWRSSKEFGNRLREMTVAVPNARKQWLRFPEALTLAELAFDGAQFQAKWHFATNQARRDEELDKTEVIEGDDIEFRAYRNIPLRSVVRFVIQPAARRAALFIQIPLGERHQEAKNTATDFLDRFLPVSQLSPVPIGEAIKRLDQQTLVAGDAGIVHPQQTRLRASGASVEFRADAGLADYMAITAVRHVRRAVKTGEFTGDAATFRLELKGAGIGRTVQMALSGRQDRVYLKAKMTATEVWSVLDPIYD